MKAPTHPAEEWVRSSSFAMSAYSMAVSSECRVTTPGIVAGWAVTAAFCGAAVALFIASPSACAAT